MKEAIFVILLSFTCNLNCFGQTTVDTTQYINTKLKTLFIVSRDSLYGISDGEKMIVPFEYDFIESSRIDQHEIINSERITFWTTDDKCGFFDTNGNIVIDPIYDRCSWFQDEIASVYIRDSLIFINKNNESIFQQDFEQSHGFSEGICKVEKNGKVGFINLKGEIVIPFKFDSKSRKTIHTRNDVFYYHRFNHGLIPAFFNNKECIINNLGEIITDFSYTNYSTIGEGYILSLHNHKQGLINIDGSEIIKPVFDFIESLTLEWFLITQEGKKGVLDNNGQLIVDCIWGGIEVKDGGLKANGWFENEYKEKYYEFK